VGGGSAIKEVIRLLAVWFFTVLEVLDLPSVPSGEAEEEDR